MTISLESRSIAAPGEMLRPVRSSIEVAGSTTVDPPVRFRAKPDRSGSCRLPAPALVSVVPGAISDPAICRLAPAALSRIELPAGEWCSDGVGTGDNLDGDGVGAVVERERAAGARSDGVGLRRVVESQALDCPRAVEGDGGSGGDLVQEAGRDRRNAADPVAADAPKCRRRRVSIAKRRSGSPQARRWYLWMRHSRTVREKATAARRPRMNPSEYRS